MADGAVTAVCGWIDCFGKAALKGVIRGVGLNEVGEAAKDTKILSMTYEMGKKI